MTFHEIITGANGVLVLFGILLGLGLLIVYTESLYNAARRKQRGWFYFILLIPILSILYWFIEGIDFFN